MNKDEAVMKLSKVARISMSYAEDLYDSFFEKPVVPQFVADWYEQHKISYDYELWDYLSSWEDQKEDNFKKWIGESYETDKPIITLVNMHQFGYEVEEEKRYTVRIKGLYGYREYLNKSLDGQRWFVASKSETEEYKTKHTRKELEEAGFGEVFDNPMFEIEEVK